MATRIITELVDDVDPTQAATETVHFGLDGKYYEIDLNEERAQRLREEISHWTEHARPMRQATAPRSRTRYTGPTGRTYDPAKVRAWATTQGIDVKQRGRIPAEVIQAYQLGHSD